MFNDAAQLLAPEAVLAVLLLAALVLREAFGPVDIVRWVLAGSLPYLALPHIATKELAAAPPEFPLQLLQPQGAASSDRCIIAVSSLPRACHGGVLKLAWLLKACRMLMRSRWLRRLWLRSCGSSCRPSMCRPTCSALLSPWTSLRYGQ